MTVRFNCGACRAVLKVPEVVTVERKVRCTSCGVVILLTPDEASPTGMTATLPDTEGKKSKHKAKVEAARQRRVLLVVLGVVVVILAGGLLWTFWGPSNRAAVEGEVKLDNLPLANGTILFIAADNPKRISAKGTITNGHYKLAASEGPYIGMNNVEIRSPRLTGKIIEKGRDLIDETIEDVHADYNDKTKLQVDIKPGSNVLEVFKVKKSK